MRVATLDDARLGRASRASRDQVTEAIEPLRRDKVVGSSLEAEVDAVAERTADPDDLAELFITSTVHNAATRWP